MNWQHLLAFLWLRWRLLANQWGRGGAINAMLMTVAATCTLVMIFPLFIAAVLVGVFALPHAEPLHLLYIWDGCIVAFAFFLSIGVVTDLQRTESLSLGKFLHLPVSVNGAFLINYISSWLRLSLLLFVPVLFGLSLGLVFSKGPLLLTALPLTAALFFMVTALTYQFQGWLASLMSNPRRRRAMAVASMMVFVVIFQLPNLLNIMRPWQGHVDQSNKLVEDLAELNRGFQAQEFDAEEHLRRQQQAIEKNQAETQQADQQTAEQIERIARVANMALPIGWLPLGVMNAAEGNLLPAALGFLGMMLIGAASLWRAYRTTLQLYQGGFTSRGGRPTIAPSAAAATSKKSSRNDGKVRVALLERQIPGVSEPVAATALAGLQSLMRAPEAKMMLLMPVLMGAVFGSLMFRHAGEIPLLARPALIFGALAMVLIGMLQLMANQFGFDRDGFRAFVLCAASRRDILLGKNLAFAPLAVGMALVMVIVVEVICPLRLDHLLAIVPQFVAMFLLFCLVANLLSIYAPMPIAAGALKPAAPKLVPVLLQMAMFTCFFPLTQLPTMLPLGIEAGLESLGWTSGLPVCLALSLVQCAAVVFIYRFALNWQGRLLQSREQKILETVTNRAA